MTQAKKKSLIMGGLFAAVIVMAIGYATFATRLNITGTSTITSSWGVEITNIEANKTASCTNSSNPSTCTTAGNISSSVDQTTKLSATFNVALISPGDSVVYTVTVENKGNLDAKLNTITLSEPDNEYVDFSVDGIEEGDTLTVSEKTKTFTVTVTYVNVGAGQGQPTKTDSSFKLTLNYVQNDGSSGSDGGSTTTPSTTSYYVWDEVGHNIGDTFDTTGLTPKTSPSGKEFFLKYVLDGTTISEVWACHTFGILSEPVCVRGGTENGEKPSNFYNDNTIILSTLSNNPSFVDSGKGKCMSEDTYMYCEHTDFNLTISSSGSASASNESLLKRCIAKKNGSAICERYEE